MLSVIYKEEKPSAKNLSFVDVFLRARKVVKAKGFEQIPQLSSSRNIDVNQPFDLMSNKHGNKGTRYAVLIGINYTRHKQGQLSGCWNDVHNIKKYIMDVGKFKSSNMTILLDDGKATSPTRANIMKALDQLCKKVSARMSYTYINGMHIYHSLYSTNLMLVYTKSANLEILVLFITLGMEGE